MYYQLLCLQSLLLYIIVYSTFTCTQTPKDHSDQELLEQAVSAVQYISSLGLSHVWIILVTNCAMYNWLQLFDLHTNPYKYLAELEILASKSHRFLLNTVCLLFTCIFPLGCQF